MKSKSKKASKRKPSPAMTPAQALKIEFLSDSQAHQVRGLQPLQPIPANYGGVD
jgi:hypothetical protein